MKHYIFGFDAAHPAECAKQFAARGIDAVIAGGFKEDAARALAEAGIDLYLCYGAHGLNAQAHKAVDTDGAERVWFGSACPNDEAVAEARLDAVLQAAVKIPGLKGVFVDGARFASFASAEGADAFFTCFCPTCMAKMSAMGIDTEAVRKAVAQLRRGESADAALLTSWLDFRQACVQTYMEKFVRRVKAVNPAWETGAFVFAPSLGRFVGQTAAACASLDMVAPMLYRAYPHEDGPACMGHEWAGLIRLLGAQAGTVCRIAGSVVHAIDTLSAEKLLDAGFPPEAVAAEVAAARSTLRPGQSLLPILQIEDDQLTCTRRLSLQAGADGVGYFAYGQAELPLFG